jgi:hypothetical protein
MSSAATPAPTVPSAQTCPAYNRSILRTDAVVFWNTRPILRSHNLFRFGHSSNITAAIVPPTTLVPTNSSTNSSSLEYTTTTSLVERRDYLVGLLCIPIVMFLVFAAWLAILGVFRCRPRRFGFLAGRRIVLPSKPVTTSRSSSSNAQPVTLDGDPAAACPASTEKRTLLRLQEEPNGKDGDFNSSTIIPEPVSAGTATLPPESDAQPLLAPNDSPETASTSLDAPGTGTVASQRSVSSHPPDPEGVHESHEAGSVPESLAVERQQIEDWKELVQRRAMRMARIRIAVLVSGLTIVVMAVLMIVYGVQNLSASVTDSLNGIDSALGLCDAALALLDSYVGFRTETMSVTESAIDTTNYTVCPQVEQLLCGGTPCTDVLAQVVDALSQNSVVFDSIQSVRNDVENIQGILTYVQSTIVSFNWAFWIAAGAVVLLAVCTLILMNSVILAWRHKQLSGGCWYRWTSRFRGFVVVPIFCVLLVLGWVFSMVFVIGSMASADFCVNSPDANVLVSSRPVNCHGLNDGVVLTPTLLVLGLSQFQSRRIQLHIIPAPYLLYQRLPTNRRRSDRRGASGRPYSAGSNRSQRLSGECYRGDSGNFDRLWHGSHLPPHPPLRGVAAPVPDRRYRAGHDRLLHLLQLERPVRQRHVHCRLLQRQHGIRVDRRHAKRHLDLLAHFPHPARGLLRAGGRVRDRRIPVFSTKRPSLLHLVPKEK